MSDREKRFRNHVRAAKEWLGRAENSLDQQEDIRGDLSLMLAQAELQHAKESKQLTWKGYWLRRAVPFLAAGLIAGGCVLFVQWDRPASRAVLPAEHTAEVQQLVPPALPEQPLAEPKVTAAAAEAVIPPKDDALPQPAARAAAAEAEEKPQPAAAVRPESAAVPAPSVPPQNMQKLMRSAGQALRAQ